jgi:hypothetical protein
LLKLFVAKKRVSISVKRAIDKLAERTKKFSPTQSFSKNFVFSLIVFVIENDMKRLRNACQKLIVAESS